MPSWSAMIVLAVLGSCAVVVVAGYFRGNRKIQAAASAADAVPADMPAAEAASAQPERDERHEPTESWIWG